MHAAIASILLRLASLAQPQSYPSKPIHLIVPSELRDALLNLGRLGDAAALAGSLAA